MLVSEAGRLVDRETLLKRVWGNVVVSEGVLKVAVRELRVALRDDARAPRFIETVAKSGYRFIAPLGRRTSSLPGRDTELAALRTAAAGSDRCFLVHGIGGIGKTAWQARSPTSS